MPSSQSLAKQVTWGNNSVSSAFLDLCNIAPCMGQAASAMSASCLHDTACCLHSFAQM